MWRDFPELAKYIKIFVSHQRVTSAEDDLITESTSLWILVSLFFKHPCALMNLLAMEAGIEV